MGIKGKESPKFSDRKESPEGSLPIAKAGRPPCFLFGLSISLSSKHMERGRLLGLQMHLSCYGGVWVDMECSARVNTAYWEFYDKNEFEIQWLCQQIVLFFIKYPVQSLMPVP